MKSPNSIIDFNHETGIHTYCGQHLTNQTIQGYILALEEMCARYAKKETIRNWVCTSTFGFGEGHYEAREVMCLDLGSDVLSYVNRVFNSPEINEAKTNQHYFSHFPVGGKFHFSEYIERLKTLVK